MSEMHTPGPWSYDPQDGQPGHCYRAQVWRPDGIALADICSTHNPDEATANARLIAAAPELLEALTELRDWYQAHTGLPACSANAAIGKATGADNA